MLKLVPSYVIELNFATEKIIEFENVVGVTHVKLLQYLCTKPMLECFKSVIAYAICVHLLYMHFIYECTYNFMYC